MFLKHKSGKVCSDLHEQAACRRPRGQAGADPGGRLGSAPSAAPPCRSCGLGGISGIQLDRSGQIRGFLNVQQRNWTQVSRSHLC